MAEERRTKETKNQITTSSADAAQPQPSEFKLVWITRWTCSACSVPTCYAHRVEDSDNDNEEEEEDHGDQEGVPPEAWRSVKDEATGRTYIYIYCLHEDERVCLGEIGSNRRIRFLPHGLCRFRVLIIRAPSCLVLDTAPRFWRNSLLIAMILLLFLLLVVVVLHQAFHAAHLPERRAMEPKAGNLWAQEKTHATSTLSDQKHIVPVSVRKFCKQVLFVVLLFVSLLLLILLDVAQKHTPRAL